MYELWVETEKEKRKAPPGLYTGMSDVMCGCVDDAVDANCFLSVCNYKYDDFLQQQLNVVGRLWGNKTD